MIEFRSPGLRSYLRPLVWHSPWLYWPIALVRLKKNIFAGGYDILIDGFPRSANTYAGKALEYCQGGKIVINSHNHSPASVIAAIWRKKPVLVLVRDPVDTITSWVIHSRYPVDYVIRSYIQYYGSLIGYRDRICVATFEQVIGDFSQVVTTINQRYGTVFQSKMLSQETIDTLFASIESDFFVKNRTVDELKVSRPSLERLEFKRWILSELKQSRHVAPLAKAYEVHRQFAEPQGTVGNFPNQVNPGSGLPRPHRS